ncbi:hypothetical protein BDK92_7534 [Micromonospora pisi]|uniref:Uncharacterized protein n=1 Tax=Micromonospora pisi TaxID=589240 RepID=A0A495JVQ6_9ACTN|nr:hypothetical protein [Micromonospora pisi]RKR93030.1 hypothetical protein BDK92_7534 [Micromonospora pisi]
MTENQTLGGFAGDPTAALTVAGSTGCCGNPAQTTNITLPDPSDGAGGTCCGTPAAAEAANTCCAPAAKADAVASGTGCCE